MVVKTTVVKSVVRTRDKFLGKPVTAIVLWNISQYDRVLGSNRAAWRTEKLIQQYCLRSVWSQKIHGNKQEIANYGNRIWENVIKICCLFWEQNNINTFQKTLGSGIRDITRDISRSVIAFYKGWHCRRLYTQYDRNFFSIRFCNFNVIYEIISCSFMTILPHVYEVIVV